MRSGAGNAARAGSFPRSSSSPPARRPASGPPEPLAALADPFGAIMTTDEVVALPVR